MMPQVQVSGTADARRPVWVNAFSKHVAVARIVERLLCAKHVEIVVIVERLFWVVEREKNYERPCHLLKQIS